MNNKQAVTNKQNKRESIALTNRDYAYKYYTKAVAKMEQIDNPNHPNHSITELIFMIDDITLNLSRMKNHLVTQRTLNNER